jgi:hypothetical protein
MRMAYMTINFDGSNYLYPLKAQFDYTFNDSYRLGSTIKYKIALHKSIGMLMDSYYSSDEITKVLQFYQSESSRMSFDPNDDGTGTMIEYEF